MNSQDIELTNHIKKAARTSYQPIKHLKVNNAYEIAVLLINIGALVSFHDDYQNITTTCFRVSSIVTSADFITHYHWLTCSIIIIFRDNIENN